MRQGKTAGESLARGTVSGVIEAATEKLPLEQMSKILHSGGTNAVKNILRQMGTEATEESASYFLNYVADLAANDPDAKFSLAELTQSAAGGAFGGLVFGAAGAVGSRAATDTERMNAADAYDYNQVQQLVQLDSELQAALKLPGRTYSGTCGACGTEQDGRQDFRPYDAAGRAECGAYREL